jgi:hypothetical protein
MHALDSVAVNFTTKGDGIPESLEREIKKRSRVAKSASTVKLIQDCVAHDLSRGA